MDIGFYRDMVMVFGSNLAGRHGRGAAKDAAQYAGAEMGVGEGPTGKAYALPTKDKALYVRDLSSIGSSVRRFLAYAAEMPHQTFMLTRIGCGLAGYTDQQMAPMFAAAPSNVRLPGLWLRQLGRLERARVIVTGEYDVDEALATPTVERFLESFDTEPELVFGDGQNVDLLDEPWANQRGYQAVHFPPEWDRHGEAAGDIRCQVMAWYATDALVFKSANQRGGTPMTRAVRGGGLSVESIAP